MTEERNNNQGKLNCILPTEHFKVGAERGSITAIDDPSLVSASEAEEKLSNFSNADRVIGLPPSFHQTYGKTPLAIPLNMLFAHEVMNLDGWASRPLVITFCPLTSSTLVFDRRAVDGAKFDVSGLLLNNNNKGHPGNLVMVDEREGESLWPQMSRRATCGPDAGTTLNMLPAIEMRWGRWKELHPSTEVALQANPSESSTRTQTAQMKNALKASLHTPESAAAKMEDVPQGRVLGIPEQGRIAIGTGGLALAFQDLDGGSLARAIEVTVNGTDMVVFWNAKARTAMAFETSASFSVQNGQIVDDETQSVWTVEGQAVEGPREGEQLDPVEEAYVAAGPAWFDFQPDSNLWNGS